jgi:iron complex transport system substrate-binding protein
MRIASLVPSSTEILFELGLGDQVVAVTHECDWPAAASSLPHLTRSVIPDGLAPADIDRVVRETLSDSRALYELDRERLAELEPDLIVTQAVCDVCAVSFEDVVAVASTLPSRPRVLSLDPLTLGDVLADLSRLGAAAGSAHAGERLLERCHERLAAIESAVAGQARPAVLALEWLDPPFVAGHWVPEMIELAGGRDVLGRAGERSRTAGWDELIATPSDAAVVMPCGYDADGAAEQAQAYEERLRQLSADRIAAVNASAFFSRPGPRLVTGVELLAHFLHPYRVSLPAQASEALRPLPARVT